MLQPNCVAPKYTGLVPEPPPPMVAPITPGATTFSDAPKTIVGVGDATSMRSAPGIVTTPSSPTRKRFALPAALVIATPPAAGGVRMMSAAIDAPARPIDA